MVKNPEGLKVLATKIKMPRATVLMSVYNAAPFLQECIDSVLQQTYADFEFRIIDDASTDSSKEIINRQADPRIKKFFNETNLGIASSLNRHFHNIQSEYIFRMDADDVCLPNRFEKQIAFMDKNPRIGMSGGALLYFGKYNYTWFPAQKHRGILARLFFNCAIPNPALVIRTSCIAEHNLAYDTSFPAPPMEDYALLIDSIGLFEFGNLHDTLVKHREHAKNQSTIHLKQKQESMIRIYEKLFARLRIATTPSQRLIHYQLGYNLPDFKEYSIDDFINWSNYLIENSQDPQSLKKVLRFYLIKLLKHLKFKPVSAFKLFFYIISL